MAEISSDDDYSPEKTLITFARPIPLLRVPIPAGPTDDPALGPHVLGFPSPNSFRTGLTTTRSKLIEQCETGSRVGCSISASTKCTPPWWKSAFFGYRVDFEEREECEEREYNVCIVGSTRKCVEYAEEKCLGPFRSCRVRVRGSGGVGYVRGSDILDRRE
ncbi:hypothetical protein vseg_016979 [Gypsophila vaccaria]